MSQGRQGRPRSRTPPARTPPETVEAVWRRRWQAASRRLDEMNYLVATAYRSLPANTEANLGAKLAAFVSLWQHRAEALHVLEMLEEQARPWFWQHRAEALHVEMLEESEAQHRWEALQSLGDASPRSLGTQT